MDDIKIPIKNTPKDNPFLKNKDTQEDYIFDLKLVKQIEGILFDTTQINTSAKLFSVISLVVSALTFIALLFLIFFR